MAKIVKFSKLGRTLQRGFEKPLKNSKLFFDILGIKIDQQAQNVFKTQGASLVTRGAGKKWKKLSMFTLHPSHVLKNGGKSINLQKWRRIRTSLHLEHAWLRHT